MVNGIEISLEIPGLKPKAHTGCFEVLNKFLNDPGAKNREAICNAYLFLLRTCASANASDLWHHVVYRQYCEIFNKYRPQDPKQSWVRASGDALELTLERFYTPLLAKHDIRIRALISRALISRAQKKAALVEMGLRASVGDSKLDVALYVKRGGAYTIYGGVHVKASLAERVSDDVPCSRAMMAKGFWSPLWTLDVKSFPPPHGDLINRTR